MMGLNKRLLTGIGVFALMCMLTFNFMHLYKNESIVATVNNDKQHSYLVVIGSPVSHVSRRSLIRSAYFNMEDNLDPLHKDQQVDHVFCIYGEPAKSNTPEKRALETEKMEYNDISLLGNDIEFNEANVMDWVDRRKKDYDYVIIQDIYSFIALEKLIALIETKGDKTIYWGQDEKGVVIGSTPQTREYLASQIWENSVESTNKENMLITDVYQDQDFIALKQTYQLKPLAMVGLKSLKAVVTSSYIYDKCMEPSATRASLNKRDYADKHGYKFVARSREFAQQAMRPDQRRTVWGKIDVIQKVLPKVEWLFWLDMDAVIMNPDISIDDLLNTLKARYSGTADEFDRNIDFIIVRPGTDKMINAGVFLIKNTPWSFDFLKDVQEQESWYRQGPSYEQGAMWDVMRKEKYMHRTLYLNRENHVFNTFPKFYEQDDFIVHFAPDKCPNAATMKGLVAADKIKKGKKITAAELL